jgi:hypothetical protein
MKDENPTIKERFFNLIMDNGVSLTLAVAFCIAVYYIVHEQNQQLLKAIYDLREDKRELIDHLIECYKIK